MDKRTKWLLFGLMAAVQLGALAWMIRDHEQVLEQGTVYKFRTAPIDPRDPFRGEYVVLNFEAEQGRWPLEAGTGNPGTVNAFGVLGVDTAGYAIITDLRTGTVPAEEHLPVTFMTWGSDTVDRIALPFDRYYMQEGDGAATEELLQPVWEVDTMIQPLPAHAVVRVLDGKAVVEDLIVDGRPVKSWLLELQAKAPATP
jgi:uncharacterized membrane-anchored protein